MSILKSPPRKESSVVQLPDVELINLVKMNNDSAALVELTSRHTGIYNSIVYQYMNSGVNIDDLVDDRALNIYNMARAYDSTRGMKFSSFVGSQTKFICLDEVTKKRREGTQVPIDNGSYVEDADEPLNNAGEVKRATDNIHRYYQNTSENMVRQNEINDLVSMVEKDVPDKRFLSLVRLRHFNPAGKPATWRECGDALGLSHEGARWLYNRYKDQLAKEVKEEIK